MMEFIKFLLLCVIFIIFDKSLAQTQVICNKSSERKMDSTMGRLLTIGNSGRRFPDNEKELIPYCQETFELLKGLKAYSKACMENLSKQVTSVLTYTFENILGQLCKKDSKRRQNLLDAADCGNKASNEFHKCYQNFIDSLLGTKNVKDDKLKIPYICCEYYKIKSCLTRRGKTIKVCDDKKLDTVNDFVESLTGNTLNLLCGDYEEGSDKCQQLGSPPKKLKSQRRTKSFVLPLIDVLGSFPEV